MTADDIKYVQAILKEAILNLKENQVPQWQKGYPNEASLRTDLANNQAYVFCLGGKIIGYSSIIPGEEPSYQAIEGKWITKGPYVTFHRVMMKRKRPKGSAALFFAALESVAKTLGAVSIRVDTHEKNQKMRRRLEQQSFTLCGKIVLHDTKEDRLAYEKRV